jgi:hypothetical protein
MSQAWVLNRSAIIFMSKLLRLHLYRVLRLFRQREWKETLISVLYDVATSRTLYSSIRTGTRVPTKCTGILYLVRKISDADLPTLLLIFKIIDH